MRQDKCLCKRVKCKERFQQFETIIGGIEIRVTKLDTKMKLFDTKLDKLIDALNG